MENSEIICKLGENLATAIYTLLDSQDENTKWDLDFKLRYAASDMVADIAFACGSFDPRDCLWKLGQARGHLYEIRSLLKIAHRAGRLETEPDLMLDIEKAIKLIDVSVQSLPAKAKDWLAEAYPSGIGQVVT